MPSILHSKAGAYYGNFKEGSVVIPANNSYGVPVSGVPAVLAAVSGSNTNVTSDSPPSQSTGTMGVNGLIQYGIFINAVPSVTQQAQGYIQLAAPGSVTVTNMWLPTNSKIVNIDVNVVGATTGVGGTPTFSIGTNANNGSAGFFINGMTLPATAAGMQIQNQGLAAGVYNTVNFMNSSINPTGVSTAASALNTSATVNGVVITQPVFNITLTLNAGMTGLPATAVLNVMIEYAYFGDSQTY